MSPTRSYVVPCSPLAGLPTSCALPGITAVGRAVMRRGGRTRSRRRGCHTRRHHEQCSRSDSPTRTMTVTVMEDLRVHHHYHRHAYARRHRCTTANVPRYRLRREARWGFATTTITTTAVLHGGAVSPGNSPGLPLVRRWPTSTSLPLHRTQSVTPPQARTLHTTALRSCVVVMVVLRRCLQCPQSGRCLCSSTLSPSRCSL